MLVLNCFYKNSSTSFNLERSAYVPRVKDPGMSVTFGRGGIPLVEERMSKARTAFPTSRTIYVAKLNMIYIIIF